MKRILALLPALLLVLSPGCGSDSNAVESSPLCVDGGRLPLGVSAAPVDAVCGEPPSPLSVAAEAQQRADRDAAAATAAELDRRDAVTVVTCGTGTPIPSDRAQSCTAVFANGLFLLFDAGDGAQRSMERLRLPVQEIDAVFVTHFHSDHIADIGEVISRSWILGRAAPLPIYGGESVERVVEGFNAVYVLDDNYRVAHHGEDILPPDVSRAVAQPIDDPGVAGRLVYERDGVAVRAFTVNHPPIEPALGYRVDYAGRSVVISGDTTATESLRGMSAGADVLVAEVLNEELTEAAECALERLGDTRNATLVRDIRTYHIGTVALGELATTAGVDTLVLTHLAPSFDNDDARADAFFTAPVAAVFDGRLITARDGTRIVVPLD